MPTIAPDAMVAILAKKLTKDEFASLYTILDTEDLAGDFRGLMWDHAADIAPEVFGHIPADPNSRVKTPRVTSDLRDLILWRDAFSPSSVSGDDRIRGVAVGLMDSSSPRVPDRFVGPMREFQSMTEVARMSLVRKVLMYA